MKVSLKKLENAVYNTLSKSKDDNGEYFWEGVEEIGDYLHLEKEIDFTLIDFVLVVYSLTKKKLIEIDVSWESRHTGGVSAEILLKSLRRTKEI